MLTDSRLSGMARKPKYDNVFLSDRDGIVGKHRLLAIDHTHCFTNGREITPRIGTIQQTKDRHVYGLFDQFRPFLTAGLVETTAKKIAGSFEYIGRGNPFHSAPRVGRRQERNAGFAGSLGRQGPLLGR